MSDEPPIKVFISYGRRDGGGFADELTRRLEQAGFAVWRDVEQLKAPLPWESQVADAIKSCDVVVALLSPHAVRRAADAADASDSVCLDELSFARFTPPATPIVPVLIAPCEPPFVICRLQYIDFSAHAGTTIDERAFDELAGAIRAVKAGAPAPERTARFEPIDFDAYLAAKTRNYVGRDWLVREISDRLGRPDAPSGLLLVAEPGWGKTAFASREFTEDPGPSLLAAHFCRFDRAESLEPRRFVESIAAMIAMRIPEFGSNLDELAERHGYLLDRRDFNDAFERLVLDPISKLDPTTLGVMPRMIIVDALDEAAAVDGGGIAKLLGETSALFPSWLKLLATTRDRPEVLALFPDLDVLRLDPDDPRNTADIAALVAAVAGSKQAEAGSASWIESKAAGNALCAAHLARAVASEGLDDTAAMTLSQGLDGVFRWLLQRRFSASDQGWAAARSIFETLLATPAPVPIQLVAAAGGDASGYATSAVIESISDLVIREADAIRLFHAALAEFLARPGSPFYVNPTAGAQRLARLCLDRGASIAMTDELRGFCDRQMLKWLVQADDLASIAEDVIGFYKRAWFDRAAGGVSMYVNGVEVAPDEARLAVRLSAAAPETALRIVSGALARGGERFRQSGALAWMREPDLARPEEAEGHRIAAEIEAAFELAKLGLGWARAISVAQPVLRERLRQACEDGSVLRGCLGWLSLAAGCEVLGISRYFEDQADAIEQGWQAIDSSLASAPA